MTWTPRKLNIGQCLRFEVGALDLWVQRLPQAWRVASTRDMERENRPLAVGEAQPTDDLEWRRWVLDADADTVQLSPILPERPVIVRPRAPVTILPKQKAQFYVGLPVLVHVTVSDGIQYDLCEEASVVLSSSWFGTPMEGELCYALRTRASQALEDLSVPPHRALCHIQVRNKSEESLDFQRLCLRTENLNIYQGAKHMWTNEARVIYRGEEQLSRVVYGRSAPSLDKAEQRIGNARTLPGRGFIFKAFDNLRAFADLAP